VGVVAVLAATLVGAAAGFGLSHTVLAFALFTPFLLILTLARPHLAAIIYMVLVYADLLSILVRYHGMPPLARFAGVALLSAVLGYRLFVQRGKLVNDHVTWWMLAYGAVVALGLVYARAPDLVMENVIEFARNFLTYLVIINIVTTSERLHAALYALLGTGTALASLTLFQSFTGTFDNNYGGLAQYRVSDITESTAAARPGGTLGDANYYGQLLLFLIPIALYLVFEGRSRLARLAGMGCAAILTAAVIYTYSRGDAIALGVMVVAAAIYKRPNPLWIAAGLVWIVVAAPLLLPSNYLARLTTVLGVAEGDQQVILGEDSIRGRTGATQAAIEMFADHPILGVGRENYPLYQLEYLAGTPFGAISKGIPPHNLYLEVAAENGIVGIIVFGGLLLTTFGALLDARKRFLRAARPREAELVVWLAIMLIGYLVSAVSLHGAFLYVFWLQVSLIVAARQVSHSYEATQVSGWMYKPEVESYGELPPQGIESVPRYEASMGTGTTTRTNARPVWVQPRLALPAQEVGIGRTSGASAALPGQSHVITQSDTWENAVADSGDLLLTAAEDALSRDDAKVARAMVELALERNPYNEAAWGVRMRVRQAEQGVASTYDQRNNVVGEAAHSALRAAGDSDVLRHEVSEKLYDYWHTHGGVLVFGYPISPRFAEVGSDGVIIEVQYFERARLEHHPQRAGMPHEIIPGNLGLEVRIRAEAALQKHHGLEDVHVVISAGGTRITTPSKFFAFWEENGGPDIFGYPITPLLTDTDTMGHRLAVQYFERARLEYHPQLAGTVYEVQISRLGMEVFRTRYGTKS